MHEYYYWSIQENNHCNNDKPSADVIVSALRSKSFCSHFNRLGGLSNFFLDDIWYIIIQFSLTVLVFLNCSEIRDAFWHFDRLGGVRIKFGSWFILSIAPVPVFCCCDVRAFYGHVIQQLQRLLSFPPPQSVHHRWLMAVVCIMFLTAVILDLNASVYNMRISLQPTHQSTAYASIYGTGISLERWEFP